MALRQGVDTDDVAIAHLVAGRHGVGANVVAGAWLQVVEAIDAAAILNVARRALVSHGGLRVGGAVAEALFQHGGRGTDGAAPENHRCPPRMALAGLDRGHGARCRAPGGEDAALGGLHGCLQRGGCRLNVGGRSCAGIAVGGGDGRLERLLHRGVHRLRGQRVGRGDERGQARAQVADRRAHERKPPVVACHPVGR